MKTKKPYDLRGSLARQEFWKSSRFQMLVAGVLLAGGSFLTSCSELGFEKEYDLDQRSPEGWDRSIYGWLTDQGNYTNTVKLIDDLGYHDVLAKTGSKTVLVADDQAYERFFDNNDWNVKSYDQLSPAQKKLLLYGNMLPNSIQLNNLANTQGNPPKVGECMRRFSDTDPLDSVPLLTKDQMPDNSYWANLRNSTEPVPVLTDGSLIPQVQLIEAQLRNNRITDDDYNWLFNNTVQRKPLDASINGVQVSEPNIRCANGFIHKLADVAIPLRNMAEVIANKPQLSTFNRLMERFCVPYPDRSGDLTKQYNNVYGTNVPMVYYKRFLSQKSKDGKVLNQTPDLKVPKQDDELLKFDPEWNQYYSANNKQDVNGYTEEQKDMAVIMVPTNEAMQKYWDEGPLKENFNSWDEVEDHIILKLINNNMLASFVQSVPSKFNTILNDANDPMGVSKEGIDSVFLACNGAIYATNVVYSPTSYISVYFPAIINRDMRIIDWGIQKNEYHVYLNSLGTTYSFFIPTHNSLAEYIDPCSYGKAANNNGKLEMLSLQWDDTEGVYAKLYEYDPLTGDKTFIKDIHDSYRMTMVLKDILDTHIVIGDVEDGHTYYRTKGGTEIRVNNPKLRDKGMTVEGSYQVNESAPLAIKRFYDQSKEARGGNGRVYVLDDENPILGTRLTVDSILNLHEEFRAFRELLEGSSLLELTHNSSGNAGDEKACGGNNISLFNTYHYTIYVPTNESIKKMQDAGKLPTWEQVLANTNAESRRNDSIRIERFLKYHIQDNALFIGATPEKASDYETSLINPKALTPRFFKLNVELTDNGIIIKDEVDKKKGTSHRVLTDNPALINLQAREYQYNSSDVNNATMLYTTSSAVVHLIDSPLEYDTEN